MSDPPAVFSKKPRSRPGALRKRAVSDDDGSAASTSEVVVAVKKAAMNHLVQGTGSTHKRRKAEAEATAAALLSDSDEDEGQAGFGVRHSAATSRPRRRSSSPPAEVSAAAIKANAAFGKPPAEAVPDDGLYHGTAKAAHILPKGFGPVKGGPANVRTITLMDYQPDVCKDYKETGFCGFGDTCKFVHDRGDYLHGWQLDNSFLSSSAAAGSFLAKQAARAGGEQDADDPDNENADLPFACLLCRKPFGKDPVVTLCGHYFDAACAIKRFAKTGKCFACGKGTNGVFNKATKIIAQTKERERLEEAAEAEQREQEEEEYEGVEIEGLDNVLDERGQVDDDDDGEGYEEEEIVVKRRPVIVMQ